MIPLPLYDCNRPTRQGEVVNGSDEDDSEKLVDSYYDTVHQWGSSASDRPFYKHEVEEARLSRLEKKKKRAPKRENLRPQRIYVSSTTLVVSMDRG